jgi:GDP/UDP-N,N'-diacetylbacillosamine 2-epimerase (hydrolysing)
MRKIWILPNNDAGSETLRRVLLQQRRSDSQVYENLTRKDYLGLLKHCQAIVGNSSSGLLEAPTFGIPAVNIGRRQANRVQGTNVINANFVVSECIQAIEKAISPEFREAIKDCINPYGDGRSSKRSLDILNKTAVDDKLLIKNLVY